MAGDVWRRLAVVNVVDEPRSDPAVDMAMNTYPAGDESFAAPGSTNPSRESNEIVGAGEYPPAMKDLVEGATPLTDASVGGRLDPYENGDFHAFESLDTLGGARDPMRSPLAAAGGTADEVWVIPRRAMEEVWIQPGRSSLEDQLKGLLAEAQRLEKECLAAYEAGDEARAEDLDAQHAEVLARLEELASEKNDAGVDWEMESREDEEEMRMLFDVFRTFIRREMPARYGLENTEADVVAQVRAMFGYKIPATTTDDQIFEAAKDSYERVFWLRKQRPDWHPPTTAAKGAHPAPDALKRAKKVDLLTLPSSVSGASCASCRHFKAEASFCSEPSVRQHVTTSMHCMKWDADGVTRAWDALTSQPEAH